MMSPEEAIADLDAIYTDSPEDAHCEADRVLLAAVPEGVREAYERVRENCDWWGWAHRHEASLRPDVLWDHPDCSYRRIHGSRPSTASGAE